MIKQGRAGGTGAPARPLAIGGKRFSSFPPIEGGLWRSVAPVAEEIAFLFLGKDFSLGARLCWKNKLSGFCKMVFLLERGSAGQGGRGDSDLPPMPPWTPYTPFKRPRDTPGPPLCRKGHFPLSLDRQGPYRARTLHGTLAAVRIATRCSYRNGPLPTLQG